MKKRALAVMLAGVMVLGAQTGVWAASDTSDQKEGELTLLMTNTWIDESRASSEEFLKVIKQYEEENPGVKITLQGASQQDIKESFQTAALAGGGADIVVMDNSGHAIDLAAMGLLYPLEELTTDEELTAQYQEGPLNSGKFEGKYYSVPWYMDCTGLYYNTERLDELGIDVPTTWEELSDAVDKAKEAGYGGIITYQSAYAFYSFFYQNECPVIDTKGKISARKDFDYDKALEGKEKLKVFTEEFPYTEARPAVINEKSIDELITNAILEVDYGQSSAEDALTSLTQKLNENIASNYQ